jgi:hypothetical protein
VKHLFHQQPLKTIILSTTNPPTTKTITTQTQIPQHLSHGLISCLHQRTHKSLIGFYLRVGDYFLAQLQALFLLQLRVIVLSQLQAFLLTQLRLLIPTYLYKMKQLKMVLVVEMDLSEVVDFVSLLAAVPMVIWILMKFKMRIVDVDVSVRFIVVVSVNMGMGMGMWVIDNFSYVINITNLLLLLIMNFTLIIVFFFAIFYIYFVNKYKPQIHPNTLNKQLKKKFESIKLNY